MLNLAHSNSETRLRQADVAFLILRLVLGVIFFAHGAQKLLGWYGGPGWSGTIGFITGMGIPAPLAMLAILAEFFGGLGVLVGLFSRLAAFGLASTMAVAILKVHLANGLFADKQGFEYPLALLAMSVAVIVFGAGRYSLDFLLASRTRSEATGGAPAVV